MSFLPDERTVLFIDGANLYSTSKTIGADIDYRAFLAYFQKQTRLIRSYYFSAILDTDEHTPLRPLVDWLTYNGFATVVKAAKEYTDATTGRRRIKGNMDIEIATQMLTMAYSGTVDHIVLFSGDNDFRSAVEAIQNRGVRVTVVSTIQTSPPMVGDDLRRQADGFIDLSDIIDNFTRRSQR